jgi:periplasmic copper chaperone A
MKRQIAFVIAILTIALALAACAVPAPTQAADAADCTNLAANGPRIKITSPWASATDTGETGAPAKAPAMGSSMKMPASIKTAAFMIIHNCGNQAETLVKAQSNLEGMTQLMSFEIKDGKSAMVDVSQIDIPAGKKVELKLGGFHVMFMNLKRDLRPGDPVELILSFKNAGDLRVSPVVKDPQGAHD